MRGGYILPPPGGRGGSPLLVYVPAVEGGDHRHPKRDHTKPRHPPQIPIPPQKRAKPHNKHWHLFNNNKPPLFGLYTLNKTNYTKLVLCIVDLSILDFILACKGNRAQGDVRAGRFNHSVIDPCEEHIPRYIAFVGHKIGQICTVFLFRKP